MPARHLFEFGPFRMDPAERLLLREGRPVPLTGKAFDALLVLLGKSGHLVDKRELMTAVWPDSFVEEGNLAVTISMIRKALGDEGSERKYIQTVSKCGYRFVAEVRLVAPQAENHARGCISTESSPAQRETEAKPLQDTAIVNPVQRNPGKESAAHSRWKWRPVWLVPILLFSAIGAALLGRTAFWKQAAVQARGPLPLRSLAVLPFQVLGVKGGDEYLGLGMADALITKLGNTGKVVIRPTSTIQKYAASPQDPQAVGREQGVDAVLDGRIQRDGDRLRLTVQLVRVKDGAALWADTFEEKFTNILAIEDAISAQVTGSVGMRLSGAEKKLLAKRFTESQEAHQAYVMGRYFWNKRTEAGLRKGLDYFQKAVAVDPTYASAYVGIADCYTLLSLYTVLSPNEGYPKAKEAATNALMIDPESAETHSTLGFIHLYHDWDGAAAASEFSRALQINPTYAMAHSWNAENLAAMRRHSEAVAEAKKALEGDPVSPIINTNAGFVLHLAGQYDQAIEMLKRAIEIDPAFPRAHFRLGAVYEQKGLYDQALMEFQEAVRLSGDSHYEAFAGHAYALLGNTAGARKVLSDLMKRSQRQYVPPYAIALVHLGLRRKKDALDWLEKAFEDRSTSIAFLKVDPVLDPLRSDPRFVALTQRIRF